MALFYLIAKKVGDIEWGSTYSSIDKFRHEHITVFPISKRSGAISDAIGITASAKFREQKKSVMQELTELLELLWQDDFDIYDLYKGEPITKQTYREALSYL